MLLTRLKNARMILTAREGSTSHIEASSADHGGKLVVELVPRANPFGANGSCLPRGSGNYFVAQADHLKARKKGHPDFFARFFDDYINSCRIIESGNGPLKNAVWRRLCITKDALSSADKAGKAFLGEDLPDERDVAANRAWYYSYIVGLSTRAHPSEWMKHPTRNDEFSRKNQWPHIDMCQYANVRFLWSRPDVSEWSAFRGLAATEGRLGVPFPITQVNTPDQIFELRWGSPPHILCDVPGARSPHDEPLAHGDFDDMQPFVSGTVGRLVDASGNPACGFNNPWIPPHPNMGR